MSEEKQARSQYPLGEPSVLDYVKSLLHLSGGERIRIPAEDRPSLNKDQFTEEEVAAISTQVSTAPLPMVEAAPEFITETEPALQESGAPIPVSGPFPWRSLLALFLGLIGQRFFEPPP